MIIALITDIHDNKNALLWALREIHTSQAQHIICLGDLSSPYTLATIATESALPVFCVFGNNDGDRVRMTRIAENPDNTLSLADREWAEISINDNLYFCTHYPDLAEHAATSSKYAAVFHGHTHHMRHEVIHNTPIINPGKLAVLPIDVTPSFALYDTRTHKTTFREMSV